MRATNAIEPFLIACWLRLRYPRPAARLSVFRESSRLFCVISYGFLRKYPYVIQKLYEMSRKKGKEDGHRGSGPP